MGNKKNKDKRKSLMAQAQSNADSRADALYTLYMLREDETQGDYITSSSSLKELKRLAESEHFEWVFAGEINELAQALLRRRDECKWFPTGTYMSTDSQLEDACIKVGETIYKDSNIYYLWAMREPEAA